MNKFNKLLLISTVLASSLMANKTFIFAQGSGAISLDSAKSTDGNTINIHSAIYDSLFTYDENDKLIGEIAESWEYTNDAKSLVVHIRHGLKFGKTKYWNKDDDLTADDVVFSFKRQYDEHNKFYKRDSGPFPYYKIMGLDKSLKDIVKVDKYTVRFDLNSKLSPFIYFLTMAFTDVVSLDYAEHLYEENKYKSNFGEYPVGSGSFAYNKRKKDEYIKLVKNKTAFHQANIDSLIIRVIKDNSVRAAALEAGDVDAIKGMNAEDIPELKKQGMKVEYKSVPSTGYIAFNMEKKPFDKLKVRRAISLLIDQDSLIKNIFKAGTAEAAINMYPSNIIGWPQLPKIKQNVKEAKKLLAEAGYPKGFKTSIWYMPVSRPYMPNGKKTAQILQADLALGGIDAKLVTYDWGVYIQKTSMGEHDMAMIGWSAGFPDPDNFLYALMHGQKTKPSNNISFYKSKKFDSLIDKAREVTDVEERSKLYKKASRLLRKDMPIYLLAHAKAVVASKQRVTHIKPLINTLNDFSLVKVK